MREIRRSDFKVGSKFAIITTDTYMPMNTVVTVRELVYESSIIQRVKFVETELVINFRYLEQYTEDLLPYDALTDEEKFLFGIGGIQTLRDNQ